MKKSELREKLRIFQYNDRQGIELSEDHLDYIMSLFDSFHTQEVKQAEQKGYARGYNTGWVKAGRSHDVRRLTIAVEQLRALATTIEKSTEAARLTPPAQQEKE